MFLMGDVHGSPSNLKAWIRQLPRLAKNGYYDVVCLGDVGIRYGGEDWAHAKTIKNIMASYPNLIWHIMRGNHDDRYFEYACEHKDKYTIHDFSQMAVENEFPNILYGLDEGYMRGFDLKHCLMIPGAYSVDKWYRLEQGWPWNKDEQLTQEEMDRVEKMVAEYPNTISYVFSHTCPISWQDEFKDDLFLNGLDQSTVDNTMEVWLQEKILPLIEKNNPDYKWYFGHYHDDRVVNEHATMVYKKNIQL